MNDVRAPRTRDGTGTVPYEWAGETFARNRISGIRDEGEPYFAIG